MPVLFDAGLPVCLVLKAFGQQRRDVLGSQIDFDEPGAHKVAGGRGLGVQVRLQDPPRRPNARKGAPGGGLNGAVREVDSRLAVGIDQSDMGICDGQSVGDEAGRWLVP